MLPRTARLIWPLLILIWVTPPAAAQDLSGRVIDATTGAPVVGGIVKAIGPTGTLLGSTLTDAGGAFTLRVPQRIQVASLTVERIGNATQTFGAAAFGGPSGIELQVATVPVALDAIVATAQSFCRATPGDGGSVQTIWDEARKSLEITALSETQRVARFETERYERDLDPADYMVLRGSSTRHAMTSESPYRSISVEQMTGGGWIDGDPLTGMALYAPDAAILLTDAFANQHCFTAERDDDAILLHFTPNRQRASHPELEGTLVLHPGTSELVELRFSYVGIPELRRGGHAGGEIAFLAAPNGIRVVRQWAIRGPVMSLTRRGAGSLASEEFRVDYVHEEGGRILSMYTDGLAFRVPTQPLDLGSGQPGQDLRATGGGQVASSRMMNAGSVAELVVRNDDSRAFHVTHVELRNCINTALKCGDYPVDVTIGPGETRVVFRIRKEIALDPFRYEWSYVGERLEAVEVAVAEPVETEQSNLLTVVPAASAERFRSTQVVMAADIPEARFQNALEFVQAMRPQWLTQRAIGGLRLANGPPPPQIRVYVDDFSMTPSPWDKPEDGLKMVPVDIIDVIGWVDGPSATIRWGTNNQLGAIVITTRR